MTLSYLRELCIPTKNVSLVRRLLQGRIHPDAIPAAQKWLRECYHRPSHTELVLCACNELLEGFGVEAIIGRWVDSYHGDVQASYVNMGDSYTPTVIRDHVRKKWLVSSVGDLVERYPKRFES